MPYVIENGQAVLQDGMPLFEKSDGTRVPIDAEGFFSAAARHNAEAEKNRLKLEETRTKLKAFGDYTPETLAEIIQKHKDIDASKLVPQEQIEKLRIEAAAEKNAAIEALKAEMGTQISAKQEKLNQVALKQMFAESEFVKGILPGLSLARKIQLLSGAFKFEETSNGETLFYGVEEDGSPMYGDDGRFAKFDFALKKYINRQSDKDTFYAATAGGSGIAGGVSNQGPQVMNEKDWMAGLAACKTPAEKQQYYANRVNIKFAK